MHQRPEFFHSLLSMRHIFLIFLPLVTFAQPDCKLELDKDSIQVYLCRRADSRYKTVKSKFNLNATRGELASALLDIERYHTWNYRTLSARVIKQVSERELMYYTLIESPVLTQDRDLVVRLTVDPDPMTGGMIVEAVSLPDYLPEVNDVIRVPYSRARWNIVPVSPGKLAVEYTIDIDLGGSVPAWMVNLVAHKAPYETFAALREVIGNYRGQKVSFIRD